ALSGVFRILYVIATHENPLHIHLTYYGGASRDRTDDLIVANDALSQLSYSPMRGWVIDCPTILSALQNRHQPDRRPARALRLVQLSSRNPLDEIPRFTSNYHLAATENVCRRNRLMFAQLNLVTTRRQRWLRMGSLALHGLLLAWLLHTSNPQLLTAVSLALGQNGKAVTRL